MSWCSCFLCLCSSCGDHLVDLFWGIDWLVVAWMWEQREPWSLDEVLVINRSWVMFELKVGIFHWDLLDVFYLILLFLYFHIFLLCMFYLLDFLHLVGTHQADLIDSHLILCFLFLVSGKRFNELLPNISCPFEIIKLLSLQ